MTDTTLVINEVYRAWQGEGPSAGRLCSLVRLMGCNLACNWAVEGGGRSPCDESQTWDAARFDLRAQGHRVEAEEVADRALALAGRGDGQVERLVIITGGEPLLWQDHAGWLVLLDTLGDAGCRIEIETNGTIVPHTRSNYEVTAYNCSPKLASAGMPRERRIVPEALEALAADYRTVFKFVAATPADLTHVRQLLGQFGIAPHRVWIMPAGTSRAGLCDLAAKLAPDVLAEGWNLTLRQHHLIYDTTGEPR